MADSVGKLNLKLAVDGSEFGPGLQRESQNLNTFAAKTQSTASLVTSSLAGVAPSINSAFQNLLSGATTPIQALTQSISGIGSALLGTIPVVGTLTAALTLGLGQIATAAENTTRQINELSRTARQIGESRENTQILNRALEGAGVTDPQGLLLRFQDQLANAVNEPGGAAGNAFRRLGLDAEELASSGTQNALRSVIEALHRVDDAFVRANTSRDIFGRDFREMADLIEQGGRAFDRAAQRVRAGGSTDEMGDFAAETQRRRRAVEAQGMTIGGAASQLWDWVKLGVDRVYVGANERLHSLGRTIGDAITDLRGVPRINWDDPNGDRARQQQAAAANVVRPDLERVRRLQLDRELTTEANRLTTQWREQADTIGLSSRQAAIFRLEMRGASDEILASARNTDRQLSMLEATAAAARQLSGMFDKNITFDGVAANSIEAQRIRAEQVVHRRNGGEEGEQRMLLAAIRDVALQQLAEQERQTDLIRRADTSLPVAPIRGRR